MEHRNRVDTVTLSAHESSGPVACRARNKHIQVSLIGRMTHNLCSQQEGLQGALVRNRRQGETARRRARPTQLLRVRHHLRRHLPGTEADHSIQLIPFLSFPHNLHPSSRAVSSTFSRSVVVTLLLLSKDQARDLECWPLHEKMLKRFHCFCYFFFRIWNAKTANCTRATVCCTCWTATGASSRARSAFRWFVCFFWFPFFVSFL